MRAGRSLKHLGRYSHHKAAAKERATAIAALIASATALALLLTSGAPAKRPEQTRWHHFHTARLAVDLTGPRGDGRLVAAVGRHLSTLGSDGTMRPFARGPRGYTAAKLGEPYIAMTDNASVPGAGCSFRRDDLYAIHLGSKPGVIRVTRRGHARFFAALPGTVSPRGIAFDQAGRFGHRLLVITRIGTSSRSRVFSIDCRGRLRPILASTPEIEGGIAVAPRGFGDFGGKLIAPSERTGRIWAIGPNGGAQVVARPGLHAGGDVGVESLGFAPRGPGARSDAYVADRLTPPNRHPGTGAILRLGDRAMRAAGVRGGDLVVVTEASGRTVRVRCGAGCSIRPVAHASPVAHIEGHVAFMPG